jgi:hypothetical protein
MGVNLDLGDSAADSDYIYPTHLDKNQHNLSSGSDLGTDTECGCRTILQTRKFFWKGPLAAGKELKFAESDFAVANGISVSKWKD